MSVCFWDVPFGSVKITEKGYEYNQDTMELVIGLGVFWQKNIPWIVKNMDVGIEKKYLKYEVTPYVLNWHLTSWTSKKNVCNTFVWSNFMQMDFLNLNKFLTKSCRLSTLVAWFSRDVRTPLVLLEWLLLSHFLTTLLFPPSSISLWISRKVKSDSKPLEPLVLACLFCSVFFFPRKGWCIFDKGTWLSTWPDIFILGNAMFWWSICASSR